MNIGAVQITMKACTYWKFLIGKVTYKSLNWCFLQAEDFHQKGQGLLDWLASAERQLRYRGALPEEELPLLKQIEEHKVMSKVLIYM